jgi:chloramphenicol-sensitive protein RarD
LSPAPHDPAEENAGILYAAAAYGIWGILPLYWRSLSSIPPMELTVHRIFWCALFLGIVTAVRGHLPRVLLALRDRRMLATLALTSVLIAGNWTVFLYSISTGQLVEGALGYYITPLLSFMLGFAFFGEAISRLRWAAIALAGGAVAVQIIALGHFPWIALTLAFSFGLYGYFRKRAAIAALDGLFIETGLMFPLTVVLIGYWLLTGASSFPGQGLTKDALLVIGGPLTAIPLVLFAAGARRIRMTTLGFLQYVAPSLTLLLAVTVLGEPFTRIDLIVFGFVWTALVLVGLEGRFFRASAPAA